MQPETEKLEQLREDAKQAREVASKTREYARVGDWRREAWEADTEWFDRLASAAEDLAALKDQPKYVVRARDQFCTQYYRGTQDRYYVDDPAEAKHFTCRDCAEIAVLSEHARVPSRLGQPFEVEVIELAALLAEGQPAKGEGGA